MSASDRINGELTERRMPDSNRRRIDRRSNRERRYDRRIGEQRYRRSFYGWLRSFVKIRMGVDRRRNIERRKVANDRRLQAEWVVSKEELTELLR